MDRTEEEKKWVATILATMTDVNHNGTPSEKATKPKNPEAPEVLESCRRGPNETVSEGSDDSDIVAVWMKGNRKPPQRKRQRAESPEVYEVKACRICGKFKAMNDFHKIKKGGNVYRRRQCIICRLENERKRCTRIKKEKA